MTATRASALRRAYNQVGRALPGVVGRTWLFVGAHGRVPALRHPRTFSDKVTWRILHDRRPELAWTCDKLQMKEHARASGADVRVPEVLWVGTDVRELAAVDLPAHWVLKPAHRSGLVCFGDATTDLSELRRRTQGWLDDVRSGALREWAYSRAAHVLYVEELLGTPGDPPPDYKVYVFDGEPALVQVLVGRFSHLRGALFTPAWEKLDARWQFPDAGCLPRPDRLPELLEAAATLAAGFDFMRVDLYLVDGTVVFGEYTPYPGNGLARLEPPALDAELGARWHLPPVAA